MKRAGVIALLTGAALAVMGSLLPLYAQVWVDGDFRSEYRLTVWGSEYSTSFGGLASSSLRVLYGVPMVVAAVLLVVVAVLVPTRLPPRVAVAVRVGAVAAAALLSGSVWTVGQIVLMAALENDPTTNIETRVDMGIWMLVAACLAAMAGALLVQHRWAPVPTTVYQFPDDDDTDTPPMGVPIHPSVSTEESPPV